MKIMTKSSLMVIVGRCFAKAKSKVDEIDENGSNLDKTWMFSKLGGNG